ncbi:sensor histidine kinase [Actinophytocola gossypii]|uniref:sensor histidine kinase n=1 Tax=Actinophytocola gossypii TaxID=2812003 RepID=UPI0021A90D9E|nr:sensor histidine kinase [Actinophytocola gossypii]
MDEPQELKPSHEWVRWFWLWDVYFVVGFCAVSLLMVLSDASTTAKIGAVSVLAAMAAWYTFFGRPMITEKVPATIRQGRIFAGGVVLLLVIAVMFDGNASFALFAACPLVFMTLTLREAVPVIIGVNLLPPVSTMIRDGMSTTLAVLGPGTLFTTAFALAVGVWIHRIIAESEDRALLIRELEESREEITRLSREAGVTAERSRIAAEIHDTLAQGFTSLVTLVQAAESELDRNTDKARRHLALAARTARENLGEARALVAGLMPSALGTGSLDQAIHRQLERLAEETPIRATYRVDGELGELPTVIEVVLLRAVQEALTNVRRHSGAGEVTVRLNAGETTTTLTVTDDGTGFDPTHVFDTAYGLRGMRSRAAQVGGKLTVHSGASGTTIEMEVPR